MSEVEKLELQLALAKKGEELEAARSAMHDGDERTPEQIAAFKALSIEYQSMREQFREKFPPNVAHGGDDDGTDAVAAPAPVDVPAGVQEGA